MHGFDAMALKRKRTSQTGVTVSLQDAKLSQAAKVREIGEALANAGFLTLKDKAEVLGLSRSTTWTILRGSHKGSGLSAAVVNRMLDQRLPPLVRKKVIEYIEKKAAGCYGHSKQKRQKFIEQLSRMQIDRGRLYKIVQDQAA